MSRTAIYLHRSDVACRGEMCREALALFDEFAAAQGRVDEIIIPFAGLLWAACDERTRPYLIWAQRRGLLPRISAPCASLAGIDLSGAYLAVADLYEANLEGADLRGTDLRGACLECADLEGALRLEGDPPIDGWVTRDGVLVREVAL